LPLGFQVAVRQQLGDLTLQPGLFRFELAKAFLAGLVLPFDLAQPAELPLQTANAFTNAIVLLA
jgi:hypothetical protein